MEDVTVAETKVMQAGLLRENLSEKDNSENLGRDVRKIRKWIVKE
jgi:hypothetical protein